MQSAADTGSPSLQSRTYVDVAWEDGTINMYSIAERNGQFWAMMTIRHRHRAVR